MILAIDLGTSKLCAAVVDPDTAQPLAIRSCANSTDVSGLPDWWHEQDPIRTLDLCFDLVRQVVRESGEPVDAVGISGQMHGVLLVDHEFRPLTNLITWRDRRAAREDTPGSIVESLRLLGKGVQQRTGCQLGVGYGAATLRWLDANGLLPKDCTALTIAGYIAASLTGIAALEETHAASWGIYDLAQDRWDDECVERLGIPREVLPRVLPSSRPLGEMDGDVRDVLGVAGTPIVCSPIGDAQASVLGAAGFSPDTIVLNLGTGGQISVPRADYAWNDELDAWPLPFGSFLMLGATLCGGWSYAYLKQLFGSVVREFCGAELSDEVVYERMVELAASAPPGANGLRVDTRFSGTRKDETITGSITGIDTTNLTPANLSLAFIEGLVSDLHSMWLASGVAGASRLVASGNAVRRIFSMECLMSTVPEEATRGAAYAAAVGMGLVPREGVTAKVTALAEAF